MRARSHFVSGFTLLAMALALTACPQVLIEILPEEDAGVDAGAADDGGGGGGGGGDDGGSDGGVTCLSDGGVRVGPFTWYEITPPTRDGGVRPAFRSVHGGSAQDVYVGDDTGGVEHWDGCGWTPRDLYTGSPIYAIRVIPGLPTLFGGSDFNECSGLGCSETDVDGTVRGICSAGPANVYAIIDNAPINELVRRQGASNWLSVASIDLDAGEDFRGCWVSPDGGAVYVGADPYVWRYEVSDGGFQAEDLGYSGQWRGIWGAGDMPMTGGSSLKVFRRAAAGTWANVYDGSGAGHFVSVDGPAGGPGSSGIVALFGGADMGTSNSLLVIDGGWAVTGLPAPADALGIYSADSMTYFVVGARTPANTGAIWVGYVTP